MFKIVSKTFSKAPPGKMYGVPIKDSDRVIVRCSFSLNRSRFVVISVGLMREYTWEPDIKAKAFICAAGFLLYAFLA